MHNVPAVSCASLPILDPYTLGSEGKTGMREVSADKEISTRIYSKHGKQIRNTYIDRQTHTHTDIHIYIYIYMCVCMCVYV